MSEALPIDAVLPDICAQLDRATSLIVIAAPGAGKTTRIPLALLDAPFLAGRSIIMLEPRRLAARAAARRMAQMLDQDVGDTVGYRVRLDQRVGPHTRIEVVTDGIFLRRLQGDPGLDGVGAVIFDEFHERSLEIDTALAFCVEARDALRPDLRLLVMSATLDPAPLRRVLGEASLIDSEGRQHPVETRFLNRPWTGRLEDGMARLIEQGLADGQGDVLAFFPGGGEIQRTASILQDRLPPHTDLHLLYGDLPVAQQDAALRPAAAGRRKIVLASPIAESSLTVDGVAIVVDSGWRRRPRFDPSSAMTRLETVRISQASATQRQGRAGRQRPGLCLRLWTAEQQRQLPSFDPPEILEADLMPLALDMAQWGAGAEDHLRWADPPPSGALAQARQTLRDLGAITPGGTLTAYGEKMQRLGTHPRLAGMMATAQEIGMAATACAVAAVLEERDPLKLGARDRDLRDRVALLGESGKILSADKGLLRRIEQVRRDWCRRLRIAATDPVDPDQAGLLVALAYPDRIAQARPGRPGQFLLSGGRGGVMPDSDPLARESYLAVAALDGGSTDAKIFLAAPLAKHQFERYLPDKIKVMDVVGWDETLGAVVARRERRLGALVLDTAPLSLPPPDQVAQTILTVIGETAWSDLPWDAAAQAIRARAQFLHDQRGVPWPDMKDAALQSSAAEWLLPYLMGITRRSQFSSIDLMQALKTRIGWDRLPLLDRLAPDRIVLPSGRTRMLDYATGEPVLALKLQEAFGLPDTPVVLDGQWKIQMQLLSPAGRPVQVTRDLAGFWHGSYRQVRAELRGRYPRHSWPEDPRTV